MPETGRSDALLTARRVPSYGTGTGTRTRTGACERAAPPRELELSPRPGGRPGTQWGTRPGARPRTPVGTPARRAGGHA